MSCGRLCVGCGGGGEVVLLAARHTPKDVALQTTEAAPSTAIWKLRTFCAMCESPTANSARCGAAPRRSGVRQSKTRRPISPLRESSLMN